MNTLEKNRRKNARARRTHTVARKSQHPRLIVFRSNKTVYAQIMDDASGNILCSASGLKRKETGIKAAEKVGAEIAEKAKAQKVSAVSFDRNGYQYHGQIKALADKAREGGLEF